MSADPYTDEARLCDDSGIVSDSRVAPGSPGTMLDPELTYRQLLNNLRRHGGQEPYTGEDFRCTGSAHLAGQHFRCTSPAHTTTQVTTDTTDETDDVQAMQFNGLDDYLRIVQWMKDCGDTYALAGEVHYTTPIMLLQTPEGTKAANPGDWIVRGANGGFSTAEKAIVEAEGKPTVRTYRVQYNAYTDRPGEMLIAAESYDRAGDGDRARIEFYRDGRTVAEIMSGPLIAIEEIPTEAPGAGTPAECSMAAVR